MLVDRECRARWCAFATLIALCTATSLLAGKGGKGGGGDPDPGPPATGKILFYDYSEWPNVTINSMDAGDGGNKTAVFPSIPLSGSWDEIFQTAPEPSKANYGGQPIWLAPRVDQSTGNAELYALRRNTDGSLQSLQVTRFDWAIISIGWMDQYGPRWGNSVDADNELVTDAFISFVGLTDAMPDGTALQCLFRIDVSAAEIAAAMDAGGAGWTPRTAQDAERLVCYPWRDYFPASNISTQFGGHDWSPDGSGVLCYSSSVYDSERGAWVGRLIAYVPDLDLGWDILGGELGDGFFAPRWSPDGSQIATGASFRVLKPKNIETWRAIITVAPDGASPSQVEAYNIYQTDFNVGIPFWSPDSKFLSYYQEDRVRSGKTVVSHYNVVRVLADGSGKTFLTTDLDPGLLKKVVAWR